ncbi:HAD family hydrolase [Neptunicella marina]|uniref:HAD-IA family hydrolase n=1 Tax=Neptunicella marina TaxID=2125989 RepID=A0A8J6IXS6_9ALTE|nr:HAD-IA family hydrolase [Neptunicella marina]MBC3767854.1 HAD-IA family hydrolase [Neptunicella marina]
MTSISSRPYQLVIFDWDGTLMNSTPRIVSSLQQAAVRSDLTVPSDDDANNIIGLSLRIGIQRLFESLSSQKEQEFIEHYRDEYLFTNQTPSPLFDNTLNVLNRLKQNKQIMAVATGKLRRGLVDSWTKTNTADFFEASRCADEAESKPSPDMLQQLLKYFGLNAQQAVMIGDTEHDMKMAEAIDMPRIGVTYGAQPIEKLIAHKPTAIINEVGELLDYLI